MHAKLHKLSREEKEAVLRRLSGVLEQRDDILFAYVYGSFTEDMEFHDIDVGVYLSDGKRESAARYAAELAGELEQKARFPVDVRVLNFAPTLFTYHVFRGLVIVERNADLHATIVERTVQKYLDMKPLVTRAIKEAFAA